MSADFDADDLNKEQLEKLFKALKQNLRRVRVGILGSKSIRQPQEHDENFTGPPDLSKKPSGKKFDGTKGVKPTIKEGDKLDVTSNAAVGVIHEFGTENIPMRSFLRVPIITKLQEYLEKNGAFTPKAVQDIIATGSMDAWLKKAGITAEEIVADAFSSGGFGEWPAHAAGYENNANQLLVDTQQLRNSITSEVK